MHGGIISIDGSGSAGDLDVIGIETFFGGGFAHTPGTAWALLPGAAGTATRISGTGNVQAPFQWPAGPTPPNVVSTHGSDQFVDTAAGASGQEAHLMV